MSETNIHYNKDCDEILQYIRSCVDNTSLSETNIHYNKDCDIS